MKTGAQNRRVVVTGMGLISSVGLTLEHLWDACSSGKSGVRRFVLPNVSPFAAPVDEFVGHINHFGELESEQKKAIRKGIKLMSREIQMGVASAQLALQNAGIAYGSLPPHRVGVSIGSDYIITTPDEVRDGMIACRDGDHFDFTQWAEKGLSQMTPLWQLKFLPNMPSSHITIYNQFRGPGFAVTNREASIGTVLEESYETICSGRADVMVSGATGSRIHPFKLIHTLQQDAIVGPEHNAESPEQVCRPFDKNRIGTVPGEGAGVLILEELEHAIQRNATIYAEIVGGSTRCFVQRQKASEVARCGFVVSKDNIKRSLLLTLTSLFQKTGILPETIGHINAHGLADPVLDSAEAQAIQEIWGDATQQIPVTSLKGHLGNPGAGGGAIEVIASILALKNDALFPILNNTTEDLACPIRPARQFGEDPGQSFVKLCYHRFGQSSAILVKRFEH